MTNEVASESTLASDLDDRHEATVRITPNPEISGLGFKEIWAYRELIWSMVRRDLWAIKNQTPTAWFWRILAPTFRILTYTVLFNVIGKVDFHKSEVPYVFVLAAGLVPWQLTSGVISGSVASVSSNARFFSKVYFPRIVLPVVSVTDEILDFLLASLLLVAMMIYYSIPLGLSVFAVPFFALWALLLGLGFGLWLAALNVLYRDVSQSLGYVLTLALYASPIVYPITVVPQSYRTLYELNPVVGIVNGTRWAILQRGDPPGWTDLVGFAATCLIALSGIWAFRRIERSFADLL